MILLVERQSRGHLAGSSAPIGAAQDYAYVCEENEREPSDYFAPDTRLRLGDALCKYFEVKMYF